MGDADSRRRISVLLTGGAGYIGSHAAIALAAAGYRPVILDDFSNSSRAVIGRLGALIGGAPVLEEGDAGDQDFVRDVLTRHDIAATIHLAAFKSADRSVADPLAYYRNNVAGLVALLGALEETGRRTLVFSSSATIYGDAASMPVAETAPLGPASPYGQSKLIAEQMLLSMKAANPAWRIVSLRYFNPVGAHPSGLIGEDPRGVPANLLPYISQVAAGRLPYLPVFGDDYPTTDGTGVRDYLHVMDLAEGHVAALDHLRSGGEGFAFNLGAGRGHSVLEMVKAFERACGRPVAWRALPRRPGDRAVSYADPTLAREVLRWQARRGIDEMCADSWRWQSQNPRGLG
jgi:UDP-glucose 4-epimerase